MAELSRDNLTRFINPVSTKGILLVSKVFVKAEKQLVV